MAIKDLTDMTELSVPIGTDIIYVVDDPGGSPLPRKMTLQRAAGTWVKPAQGRLTGTSATAVTTSDVSNITTLYYTPYTGDLIALYDGTRWQVHKFTELSLSLGTVTASRPYDVFVYDNSGTLTLEQLVWTNATTRGTALALQDGVYVKSGVATRRYLGTYYSTSTTQTQDTERQRLVWNYYNRVWRTLKRAETTASWQVTGAVSTYWRQANGSTTNQIECVIGVAEDPVQVGLCANALPVNSYIAGCGIGVDAANTPTGPILAWNSTVDAPYTRWLHQDVYVAAGYHYFAWLEFNTSTNSPATYYGDEQPTGVGTLDASHCRIVGLVRG